MSLTPKHERPPLPKHPYRTAAIVHGSLALVIVVFALLTGGAAEKAVGVAVAYFVIATGWTWWRFRRQVRSAESRP